MKTEEKNSLWNPESLMKNYLFTWIIPETSKVISKILQIFVICKDGVMNEMKSIFPKMRELNERSNIKSFLYLTSSWFRHLLPPHTCHASLFSREKCCWTLLITESLIIQQTNQFWLNWILKKAATFPHVKTCLWAETTDI
jgi:hypothetical protein